MTDDKIQSLLKTADEMAGAARAASPGLASAVRRRARRSHLKKVTIPVAAAAVVVVVLGIWFPGTTTFKAAPDSERITSLEDQVRRLQARTDATLQLIHEVLDREGEQRRLEELEARLARFRHPLEKMQEEIDQTAFIILYQANNKYRHLDLTDSAIEDYKRVIKLFPQSRWAEVARERLSKIRKDLDNKKGSRI